MSEFDFAAVMRAIKTILKVKKMTYRDLAEILEMSESGVKKILSAKDGSFGRVLQMCRALDVSLDDLIAFVMPNVEVCKSHCCHSSFSKHLSFHSVVVIA